MIRNIAQAFFRWRVRLNQPQEIRDLQSKIDAARKAHKPCNHLLKQMQEIRHDRLRVQ